MTAPRRSWSFSLRTLFVAVTVIAAGLGWLGYHIRWMQLRREVLDGNRVMFLVAPDADADGTELRRPPWALRLLGEKSHSGILAGVDLPDDEALRIQALFPELALWNTSSSTPAAPGPP